MIDRSPVFASHLSLLEPGKPTGRSHAVAGWFGGREVLGVCLGAGIDGIGSAAVFLNRNQVTYQAPFEKTGPPATKMTILRKESDIFPDDLFDLPTADAPWAIGHLRSRQEKSVARLLLDGRMPFYLPQVQQTKKSSGRTFVSHLPLFPGYIFVRRVEGLRQTLWRTSAVANLIEVPDQAQLTAELLQVRLLQNSGALLTPVVGLVPGDAVHITDGSFSGYSGIVLEERGTQRLIVSVSMLRKSVAVEFPREVLAEVKRGYAGARQRI